MKAAYLGSISDGYGNTFEDLYAHRNALFLALCRALRMGWRSKKHADGSMYKGWFVAGVTLPNGGNITYHLPAEQWDACDDLETLKLAPEWDGHTGSDVVERLILYAKHGDELCGICNKFYLVCDCSALGLR